MRSLREDFDAAVLRAPTTGDNWCHRGLVAAWLKDTLALDVFEVGQEAEGAGWAHPKLTSLRRPPA